MKLLALLSLALLLPVLAGCRPGNGASGPQETQPAQVVVVPASRESVDEKL
jgi:hypothetical protein